jgi:hypothetical protein
MPIPVKIFVRSLLKHLNMSSKTKYKLLNYSYLCKYLLCFQQSPNQCTKKITELLNNKK